jgi:TRAP-type C4-dicarboxylate transport system permease small subunit
LARKPAHISILQFDAHLLSCLRVRGDVRSLEILDYQQQRGAWSLEDGSLLAALQAFTTRLQLAEDDLYTVLPRYEITTRILTLPTHDAAEVASMIRLGAEEYVPYPPDELVMDQAILQKDPSGESQVLAAFAHREVVEGHLGLLRQAGLEPRQIYLSTACLASAAIAAQPPDAERFALVDVASGGLEVLVLRGGSLLFTRGVGTTHHGPGDAAPDLHEVALEVRGSLSAYRRESADGLPVEQVFIASEAIDVGEAGEALLHETGRECAPADFALSLVNAGQQHLTNLPLAALGAVLAAQGRAAVQIQLLPSAVHHRRALVGVQARAVRLALAAFIVLLMGGVVYGHRAWQHSRAIAQLEREVEAIAPQAEGVKAKRQQLQILRDQVDRSASVLEMLAAVSEAAPADELNINRVRYDRGSGLDIWGRAKTKDAVYLFAQQIRDLGVGQLELLSEAHSVYESAGQERNLPIFDYQISVPFPEEDTSELAAAAE